jgi:RsiW-degrading membrane proteinase PrsW (M82 family)
MGGLVFGPLVIIILELVAMVGMILLAFIVLVFSPELSQELTNLAPHLENPLTYTESMQEMISRIIQQPVLMAGVFAYTAVLIPLIEEALKPLGLWLLVGRRLTPAEGFVGGMICGAGFALFENLSALSTSGEEWALLAVIRISTALLHILNTGLMGWALANAWTKKRYRWLAFSYVFAVSVHGIWNALGIAGFALPQYNLSSANPGIVEILLGLTVIGLGLMTGINFLLFLAMNRRLRPKTDLSYSISDPQLETPPSLD